MSQAHEQLGMSFLNEGDHQSALRELLKAAEFNPENAEVQNALGLSYMGLKEHNSAILHFRKALQLKPDFPEAQNNLGPPMPI